jgi:hypothetical protein
MPITGKYGGAVRQNCDIHLAGYQNSRPFAWAGPCVSFYAAARLPEQSFIRSISQRPAGPGGAEVG